VRLAVAAREAATGFAKKLTKGSPGKPQLSAAAISIRRTVDAI